MALEDNAAKEASRTELRIRRPTASWRGTYRREKPSRFEAHVRHGETRARIPQIGNAVADLAPRPDLSRVGTIPSFVNASGSITPPGNSRWPHPFFGCLAALPRLPFTSPALQSMCARAFNSTYFLLASTVRAEGSIRLDLSIDVLAFSAQARSDDRVFDRYAEFLMVQTSMHFSARPWHLRDVSKGCLYRQKVGAAISIECRVSTSVHDQAQREIRALAVQPDEGRANASAR